MGQLSNRNIAVLSESGFEEVELTEPVKSLKRNLLMLIVRSFVFKEVK